MLLIDNMVIESENLLETLLDLERARQKEYGARIETEALMDGLRGIAGAKDKDSLFLALVDVLHGVIVFEDAFILEAGFRNRMSVIVSTSSIFLETKWVKDSVFKRAIGGRPIASFDIEQVVEWQQQPPEVREKVKSALHVGLQGGTHEAILVITHSKAKQFGPSHVKKAKKFSPLASQAFITLDLQQAIIQRDRFFQLSLDVMAIIDHKGVIKQFNSGWLTILGYEGLEVVDESIYSFVCKDDVDVLKTVISHLQKSGEKELVELRLRKKRRGHLWFSCSLAFYRNESLLYIVARDITDRVIFEQQLAHDAGHDSLTGLKNRAEFMESLQLAFQQTGQQKGFEFAILFLDLNRFKEVNDTLGHGIGDELLISFANILKEVVREGDTVARFGGDEFTILLSGVKSLNQIEEVAARIRDKCSTPVELSGHSVDVAASIGVSLSSTGYSDEEAMLQAADKAMYIAKSDPTKDFVIE